MKKIFALALTIALLSSLTVACGDVKETATVDTPVVESTDSITVDETSQADPPKEEGTEEPQELFHTKKPTSCHITYKQQLNADSYEWDGTYEYSPDGNYKLTFTHTFADKSVAYDMTYYFAPNGQITHYECCEFSQQFPDGNTYENCFFINGVAIAGYADRTANMYNALQDFDPGYLYDMSHFCLEYDESGNILNDIITAPRYDIYEDHNPFALSNWEKTLVLTRDDKGRVIEASEYDNTTKKGPAFEEMQRPDGSLDYSSLDQDFYYYHSFFEYDDDNNIMTISSGTTSPNHYNAETRSNDGIFSEICIVKAKYNEYGLPIEIETEPVSRDSQKMTYIYDKYGYLTDVFQDNERYASLHIVNSYDGEAVASENEEKSEDISKETISDDPLDLFDWGITFYNRKAAMNIDRDDIGYQEDMESYYYYEVYITVDDGDGAGHGHHPCNLEVEKDRSEVRYADFITNWEMETIFHN